MKYINSLLMLVMGVAIVYLLSSSPIKRTGSVSVSNEYFATTTRNFDGTAMSNLTLLKGGPASIGNVVITGAAAGTINIFNATTSDVNKRTGNLATSSLLIVSIPNSAAAGIYPIDAIANNGLLIELLGTVPTSTIGVR